MSRIPSQVGIETIHHTRVQYLRKRWINFKHEIMMFIRLSGRCRDAINGVIPGIFGAI